MARTLAELKEALVMEYDEYTLLEILDISSEELVEAFEEKIQNKFDKLVEDLDGE